jgi:hypothetical protein
MPKVKVKRIKEKGAKKPSAVGSRRPPGDGASEVAGAVPSAGATNGSGTISRSALAFSERQGDTPAEATTELSEDAGVPKRSLGTRERQEGIPVAALPPPMGTSAATTESPSPGGRRLPTEGSNETPEERKKRRAREISARYRAEQAADLAARRAEQVDRPNPLLMLEEEQSSRLFVWLRECPYNDAVRQMMADQGITGVTDAELNEFFQSEARMHWERRLQRAATEANALVSYVEQNPVKFSAGILAALGQEAFRQIASGEVAPEAMARMTNLFLKARADERSDHLLDLRREKMELDRRTQTEAALESFAAEIEKHPAARTAFEALKAELLRKEEE